MDTYSIKKIYWKYLNYKRDIEFTKQCAENPIFLKEIKRNNQFKNIHKGERCFILGNGPSLSQENLRLLKNEIVFSVNQISRHKDFEFIKPNYHFWADPNFFIIDENKEEDRELLEVMKAINTVDNEPFCFFPIEQYEFVKKYNLDSDLKVYYYYSGYKFYNGFKKEIDYTNIVPAFSTVVQWCISMAIYMGFREIYLLGCDNTSLLVSLKAALQKNDENDYAYSLTENEKQRMVRMVNRQGIENLILVTLRTFREYSDLYYYCSNRNIKLVNCSSTTLIDSIPKANFQDIIKNV